MKRHQNRAAEPHRLLTWFAATAVVVVSLVPDVIVGATGSLTRSNWGGVIARMRVHLVVAVCEGISPAICISTLDLGRRASDLRVRGTARVRRG